MNDRIPVDVLENLFRITNRSWFMVEFLVIKKYVPNLFEDEEYQKVAYEFGFRQAKFLKEKKLINEDLNSVVEAFKRYSSWAFFEGERFEVTKLDEQTVRLRTYECSALQAVTKRGIKYPCKYFGLSARNGFVKAINPSLEVECTYAPPDPKPENLPVNVSCEYLVRLRKT